MEENQPKTGKFSLNYGLILGLISVVFGLMLFFMDAHYSQDSANTVIGLVITTAVILWGIYSFRKANDGFLTLGEALKLGAGIGLVAGIVWVIYVVILSNFLDPAFASKVAEAQKAAAEAAGEMSPEQIEQQYQGTTNYFWFYYPVALIFNVIIGFLVGLVGGLIFKKAKPAY